MKSSERPLVLLYLPGKGGLPGLEKRHVDALRRLAPVVEWRECADEAGFLADLPDCAGAAVWRFKPEWTDLAPGLALVSTPAAGKDWVEVRPRPGLAAAFGTFHGELIAETVLGLMLAFARGIKDSLDVQRVNPWAREEIAVRQRPLRGSRAVIVGFGRIGKWIGRLLKPVGLRLTGVNRRDMARPDYFDAADAVTGMDRLDEILPETDHLVLALPSGSETERVIDARRLALLPADAVVYNIGRGNALDEAALVRALESGALRGAGLDVFEKEPLPADAAIRRCPNVILMPHVSAFAPNYLDLYLGELLPLVRGHLLGGATE